MAQARPVEAHKASEADRNQSDAADPWPRPQGDVHQATFPLTEGLAVIQWPRHLSQEKLR